MAWRVVPPCLADAFEVAMREGCWVGLDARPPCERMPCISPWREYPCVSKVTRSSGSMADRAYIEPSALWAELAGVERSIPIDFGAHGPRAADLGLRGPALARTVTEVADVAAWAALAVSTRYEASHRDPVGLLGRPVMALHAYRARLGLAVLA